MEKLNFSILINAPAEKVWDTLWQPYYYESWTRAFAEGSTVQTDNWKEGSKVIFGDGTGSGMVSRVSVNRPAAFMSFTHLGTIIDGVEDTQSEKVSAWAGATENYTLTAENGKTRLDIEMDISTDFKAYMEKTWPVALELLKGLAEGNVHPLITVSAEIAAPLDTVWKAWTDPEHIRQWNHASPDWHCPQASNDLRSGGSFSYTMAAKDGSFSFDFGGTFHEIKEKEFIDATLGDGRKWKTSFKSAGDKTIVTERFEAESTNPLEMQRGGWQAILDNFKQHTATL